MFLFFCTINASSTQNCKGNLFLSLIYWNLHTDLQKNASLQTIFVFKKKLTTVWSTV